MTSPDMDDEAMKAMARRIVARFYQGIRDHDYAQWVLEGHKDETTGVKIALAAIIETTEAAVRHIGGVRIGYERNGVNADCLGVAANNLRNNNHLKGPKS